MLLWTKMMFSKRKENCWPCNRCRLGLCARQALKKCPLEHNSYMTGYTQWTLVVFFYQMFWRHLIFKILTHSNLNLVKMPPFGGSPTKWGYWCTWKRLPRYWNGKTIRPCNCSSQKSGPGDSKYLILLKLGILWTATNHLSFVETQFYKIRHQQRFKIAKSAALSMFRMGERSKPAELTN